MTRRATRERLEAGSCRPGGAVEGEATMGKHGYTKGTCRGLVRAAGLQAIEIRCRADRGDWTEPATETAHRVVITRSGGYLRRVNGVTTFVDPTNVLVTGPGDEVAVAHAV